MEDSEELHKKNLSALLGSSNSFKTYYFDNSRTFTLQDMPPTLKQHRKGQQMGDLLSTWRHFCDKDRNKHSLHKQATNKKFGPLKNVKHDNRTITLPTQGFKAKRMLVTAKSHKINSSKNLCSSQSVVRGRRQREQLLQYFNRSFVLSNILPMHLKN